MPRRKPKPEKQIQEKIKESLDAIINDDSLSMDSVTAEDLPQLKSTEIMDFSDAKQTIGTESKALLDKMVDFYLDASLIGEDDHITYRKKIDAMNISSMMLQLKTAQHAIIKLLEEIDMGNIHPRLFEVLAQLQSQIMQMPKDYQNYMEKMEDSYKRLKIDMEQKALSGGIVMVENGEPRNEAQQNIGDGIKVRGNKGLMENLRDILGSEIEDVTVVDVPENSVVNARKKAEIDLKNGNSTEEGSSIDSGIEDDLFE